MTKHRSSIDQHRQAIGKYENERHKPKKSKPLVAPDFSLISPIRPDLGLKPQQTASTGSFENLTAPQRRARAKQKAAHRRAEYSAHVNIVPSAALTLLVLLTLLPQPVEAEKESKQKTGSGNRGVARVSLTTLEREGKAQNVFFPHTPVEGFCSQASGIGFDSMARLLALTKTETTQEYRHTKGKLDSQPMTEAIMEYVDLNKTEGCLSGTSLNASCAISASVYLPSAYDGYGRNTASAATNGDQMVANSGPIIPKENICQDSTEPMYHYSTDPSKASMLANKDAIFSQEHLSNFSPDTFNVPSKTLKTGLELVDAEHVNLFGEEDATLVVKGVVVKQENGVIASTLYVNQYNPTMAFTYVDIDPLCVVQNAGVIIQSKLSVLVDENAQVKRRDLILAHQPTADSFEGKVIIIRDIDHRNGQNIDLNADPKEQNIQVLSGFNWGDAKARGDNLIDVVDQEVETFDADSTGLDWTSTGEDDTDSTGLTSVQQKSFLIVSSAGEKSAGSYLRPRVFIMDVDANTVIGIQDRSDTSDVSDLGYAVITAGELSRQLPEGKWFYSNYPVISRPSTGELFILSPQKIARLMAEHSGETIIVDVSQLSELVIDDPELRCPELGKKLFAGAKTGQLGMECGDAGNSTTMEALNFQAVVDSAAKRPVRPQDPAPLSASRMKVPTTQCEATGFLPVQHCPTFWSKNKYPLAAIGGALTLATVMGASLFFRRPKPATDIEGGAPINAEGPNESTPLVQRN